MADMGRACADRCIQFWRLFLFGSGSGENGSTYRKGRADLWHYTTFPLVSAPADKKGTDGNLEYQKSDNREKRAGDSFASRNGSAPSDVWYFAEMGCR